VAMVTVSAKEERTKTAHRAHAVNLRVGPTPVQV
jgi:hypothetical protein